MGIYLIEINKIDGVETWGTKVSHRNLEMTLQTTIMPRGRAYYFRVRVPRDLVALIRRKELRRSLRTGSPADARLRSAVLLSAARQLFVRLRDMPMLTPEDAEIIVKDFYQIELFRRMGSVGIPQTTKEQNQDWRQWLDETCKSDLEFGDYKFAKEHLPAIKARFQLETLEGSPEEGLLLRLITDALRELNRADVAFDNGDTMFVSERAPYAGLGPKHPSATVPVLGVGGHVVPINPNAPATLHHMATSHLPPPTGRRGKSPLGLLPEFLKERNPTTETAEEYRRALVLFEGLGGRKAIAELTPDDMTQFVRHLLDLPTNYKSRLKVDDPLEAIALNKARGERAFPTLQHKTINEKYITFVTTFLKWAKRQRLTTDDLTSDLRVKRGRKGARQRTRLPFSGDQLTKIFATPLFHGCLSEDRIHDQGKILVRDWRFWLPPLGLFTGCRMNEIGQMLLADVLDAGEAENFPHLHVRLALDDEKEEGERNSLKSDASIRYVPIHPKLIELGFLDYVRACRATGHKRLFPDWKAGKTGKYSNPGSKWASRFLVKAKVKTPQHTFHSFRHTLIDALRLASVDAEYRYRMLGHIEDNKSDIPTAWQYGSDRNFQATYREIAKVTFPEIDFKSIPRDKFRAPPVEARIKRRARADA